MKYLSMSHIYQILIFLHSFSESTYIETELYYNVENTNMKKKVKNKYECEEECSAKVYFCYIREK